MTTGHPIIIGVGMVVAAIVAEAAESNLSQLANYGLGGIMIAVLVYLHVNLVKDCRTERKETYEAHQKELREKDASHERALQQKDAMHEKSLQLLIDGLNKIKELKG